MSYDVMHGYTKTLMGFDRVNRQPLDKYDMFDSMDKFMTYVKKGSAYPGQVCKVRMLRSKYYLNYQIVGTGDAPMVMLGMGYEKNDLKFFTIGAVRQFMNPAYNGDDITTLLNSFHDSKIDIFELSSNPHFVLIHNFMRKNSRIPSPYQYDYFMDYAYYNYFADMDLLKWDDAKYVFLMFIDGNVTGLGDGKHMLIFSQSKNPNKVKSGDESGYHLRTHTGDNKMLLYNGSNVVFRFEPTDGRNGDYNVTIFQYAESYAKACDTISTDITG